MSSPNSKSELAKVGKIEVKPFPKIILLGDSITQLSFDSHLSGFGAHVSNVYQRRADVLNRGFSGYNTNWILEYLSTSQGKLHIFGSEDDKQATKLVTIFFGANDASDAVLNERQHVPLDKYESNLKEIYSIVKGSCPNAQIIIICPPPIDHKSRMAYQIQRYGDKATGKAERTLELSGSYADVAQKVAEEVKIPFLHVWKEMQDECPKDWEKFLCDGLHLSKEGNHFVGKKLVALINNRFPDLAIIPCLDTQQYANSSSKCVALESFAPFHDKVDHKNPKRAFSSV